MQDPTIAQPPGNSTPVNPAPSGYSQPPQISNTLAPQPPRKNESWRSILSTILILITAPIVALLLTAFVFQSYQVDGPSMETTLQNGDRLIVLKVPRTVARLTNNDYIPARGDIIVFTKHGLNDYASDPGGDKQLIKRVIGIPGDRVVVRDGTVTIYNAANPNGYNPDANMPYNNAGATPGNSETTVNDGQVYVAGDNRSNSLDSRYFGAVNASDVVGKLVLRVFPLDQAKLF